MIKVKALQIGYFNHTRIKEGQIFEIKNMQQFSKTWMDKVDKDSKSEIKEPNNLRKPTAISDGASKALHEGKAVNPKNLGKATNLSEKSNVPEQATTGDEDVI